MFPQTGARLVITLASFIFTVALFNMSQLQHYNAKLIENRNIYIPMQYRGRQRNREAGEIACTTAELSTSEVTGEI